MGRRGGNAHKSDQSGGMHINLIKVEEDAHNGIKGRRGGMHINPSLEEDAYKSDQSGGGCA